MDWNEVLQIIGFDLQLTTWAFMAASGAVLAFKLAGWKPINITIHLERRGDQT